MGTLLTGVGVACAVYLVVDVVFGGVAAVAATAAVLVVYAVVWIALPLLRRGEDEGEGADASRRRLMSPRRGRIAG